MNEKTKIMREERQQQLENCSIQFETYLKYYIYRCTMNATFQHVSTHDANILKQPIFF